MSDAVSVESNVIRPVHHPDNQPQDAVSGSHRELDWLAEPAGFAFTVKVPVLRRQSPRAPACSQSHRVRVSVPRTRSFSEDELQGKHLRDEITAIVRNQALSAMAANTLSRVF